ncbi:sodium- and chloride-dependent glycine transporter 1-like [Haliotis rubra]|uniref:sodium- and chloride-dependent glycine transporter 1-like n=1 Tax=Haliotis rubra TaxID=36100 RepID=UPI001EE55B20|nr:sodium- and chloride-dependent glycine transporter 1-like [Haliotis rubra]
MARDRWLHHLDYLITLVGYSVGAGTFLKFPYLCMRNGGGAFLILFMLFTVIGAIPCVFVEMVIGQFSQSGPVTVWNMCPPFKGIGLGTVVISWTYATYNSAIFAWYLYYFFDSFSTYLPWTLCSNDWNTATCVTHDTHIGDVNNTISTNITVGGMTAAEEYWRFKVLDITEGLENLAGMRWPLIVYVTVGVPYLLNTIFLIRGCLLPGSAEGIYYYIYPDFEMLQDPKIWMEACAYSFYSMGIGMGCIITLSGHNNFKNNCFRDSIAMCLTDALTTIFVGFSVFGIIGHVAYIRGLDVEAFQSSGFNLAFIVYPEAVAALPCPQLWSALTFLMLMSLLIDTLVIFTFSLYSYRPPQYAEYVYPTWATVVGWMISMASILPFPVFFVWTVYHTSGTTVVEKLEKAIRPNKKWGSRIQTDYENQDVNFPTMLQESL